MSMMDKLMGRSEAGAGRGKVNPATVAEMEDAKRSPAEREARQMMRDRAAAKMADAEYNKAMPEPYKKGGSVFRASANGIAQRGKTKGKMVTMCGGGKM
jgi:protein-tyrosine-phosphatase